MSGESTYTITELAREFGVTTRAIRFYEDRGLLTPRRVGQARVYGKRERARLKLTLRGKRLGFSLAEILEMLDLYETTHDDELQMKRFLRALSQRKATLEQQREDIEALLSEICAFERQCREFLATSDPQEALGQGKVRSAA